MKKRIFYSILGVTLISVCIFALLITSILYEQLFTQAKANLQKEATSIRELFLANNDFTIKNVIGIHRITLIQDDGQVLFDTEKNPKTMDNHAQRPEILALTKNPYGESTRLSNTLGKQIYYYALRLDASTILRLSLSIHSIYSIIFASIPYMFLLIIIMIIAIMMISKHLTQKIIRPLYTVHEESPNNSYEELELFYKKIRKQQKLIHDQKRMIDQKTAEFAIITENIADGFIVLNVQSTILSINKKAIQILGNTDKNYVGKNFIELNRSEDIRKAIARACAHENSALILEIQERQYILHLSPVYNDTLVVGIVILIVDNTQQSGTEKMRREFAANVSHELKTPLTSISGYAELIKTGLAKDEDIQKFAEKIYGSAQHLIILIQDIIKISKLDEQDSIQGEDIINIKECILSIIDRLDILAKQKNISYILNLDTIEIIGIQSLFDEALCNILENAIKYNVQNGTIHIELSTVHNQTRLSIKDSGIGIPKDKIGRIFERFYRVDTSHSNHVTGTGLGLAIAKHALLLHNAEIRVESEISQGTCISICFL